MRLFLFLLAFWFFFDDFFFFFFFSSNSFAAAPPLTSDAAQQPALTEEQLRVMRLSRFGSPVAPAVVAPPSEPQEKKMKPSPTLPVQASPVSKPMVVSPPPSQPPPKSAVTAASPKVATVGMSPVDVLADPDEWVSETMSLVFRASLPQRKAGKEGVVLHRLESELLEDKVRADRLTLDHVDCVLLEVLSRCHHPSTAKYLYGCYARAQEQSEKVLNKRDPARMQGLALMQRAILTFAVLFFSAPTVSFPKQEGRPDKETNAGFGANQLAEFLDSSDAEELDRVKFAGDVFKTASDAQLVDIARPLLTVALRRRMGPRLLLQEEQSAMMREYRCLTTLLNMPRLSNAAISLKQWLPDSIKTGRDLERQTVLGPFFTPSSYPDEPHVGDALLLNKTLQSEIFPVFERLRHRYTLMHGCLQQSLMACLKSKSSRTQVVSWLAQAVNLNAGRAFMRPDFERSSTHGFMLNLSAVCMLLCEPVGAKLQTVDANYCVFNSGGVDFTGATRISWDDKQVAARAQSLQQQVPQQEVSFNTEIFWITARVLSVGWRPAAAYYNGMFNALQDVEGKLNELEGKIPEQQLQGLRLKVSLTRKDKLSAEAHVKHPDVLGQICRFYDMAARWFTITADPEKKGVWPAEPRPEIACVPQWLIDDLIFFFEWLNHHAVDVFALGAHHQNLLSFLTLLLSFDKYLHSPHLRGRVIDLFQCMIPNKNNQLPMDLFEKNKFVTKMLVPGMIRFYIDCER
jgi:ubiquitin conjugation factor E4 B